MLDPVKLSGYIDWLDNKINSCSTFIQMQQLMTLRAQAAQISLAHSPSTGTGGSLTGSVLATTLNEVIAPVLINNHLTNIQSHTNNIQTDVAAGKVTSANILTKLDQLPATLNQISQKLDALASLSSIGLMGSSQGSLEQTGPQVIFDPNPNRKYLIIQNQDRDYPMCVGFTDRTSDFEASKLVIEPKGSLVFESGRFCPIAIVAVAAAVVDQPISRYVAYEGA
ncbi:hypothetical protein [Chroococcidiopsis sp.]|uniref:hypothetical protein n=1 Tax=Chroococcidiopsis sp. TaxID=3088168 RepID=UPI003F2AD9A7